MRLLLLLLMSLSAMFGTAQTKKRFIVNEGEIPGHVIPFAEIYHFEKFTNGTATLKNGTVATQILNYNCLFDEMQFVATSGDTMAIAEPQLLGKLVIGSETYFFQNGYLRLIEEFPNITLAVRERITEGDSKRETGYGTSSSTAAVHSVSSLRSGNSRNVELAVKKDVIFIKTSSLWIGDKYNRFVRADKKTILSMYPDRRNAIEKYIKAHKTNFDDASDLNRLLAFCVSEN